MNIHPKLQAITERLVERSQTCRTRHLKLIAASGQLKPNCDQMGFTMSTLLKSFRCISFTMILTACSNLNTYGAPINHNPKIDFDPCVAAPTSYPVFMTDGGNAFVMPNDDTVGFWGNTEEHWRMCTGMAGGHFTKAYPKRILLRWISIAENQFYELDAELPTEKIKQLHQQGYASRYKYKGEGKKVGEWGTYGRIGMMLAPGGGVVVSLNGEEKREIAHFQAKKIDMPWRDFQPSGTREEWIRSAAGRRITDPIVKKQIQTQQIPFGLWDVQFRQKYQWQLTMANVSQFKEYFIEYVNAERYMVWQSDLDKESNIEKPAPVKIDSYFIGKDGVRYRGVLTFNDVTIYKAYSEFFKYQKGAARLNIAVSTDLQQVTVTLTDGIGRSIAIPYTSWEVTIPEEGKYF